MSLSDFMADDFDVAGFDDDDDIIPDPDDDVMPEAGADDAEDASDRAIPAAAADVKPAAGATEKDEPVTTKPTLPEEKPIEVQITRVKSSYVAPTVAVFLRQDSE